MGPFWSYKSSGGVSTEGDNITHRVKGGVSEVH